MPNYNSRSGLQPERNEKLVYNITTNKAQEYLQKKFDVVTRIMKQKGDNIGQVKIRLFTTDAGSRFRPFILLLPLNVLETYEKRNPEEPDIFNPEADDELMKKASLKQGIKKVISAFKYDKYDQNSFYGNDWRRARGVSRETARQLRMRVDPKIMDIGEKDQKIKMVTVLIDPIRLFHDMLTFDDDNSNFKVDIIKYQKSRSGEYKYMVNRIKKKGDGGKNYTNRLADELNRAIQGTRR